MKNTATNELAYTGIVTLSQYNGKSKTVLAKLNNSGGLSLFNFLSDCFLGDFSVASVNRPTKIMLLKKSITDNSVDYKSTSGFIYLLTKPEKIFNSTITNSTVCYSFIIPREYLNSDFNCIGLYPDSATTSDVTEYSAICEVDASAIPVSASTILVVDWELIINNKMSNDTENSVVR